MTTTTTTMTTMSRRPNFRVIPSKSLRIIFIKQYYLNFKKSHTVLIERSFAAILLTKLRFLSIFQYFKGKKECPPYGLPILFTINLLFLSQTSMVIIFSGQKDARRSGSG
jgi:hypothetical protein